MLHITITKKSETGTTTICDCDTENAICVVRDETKNRIESLAELNGAEGFGMLIGFIEIHKRLKNEKVYKVAKRIARKIEKKKGGQRRCRTRLNTSQ